MDQEYGIMDSYLENFASTNQLVLDNLTDAKIKTTDGNKMVFQQNWTFTDDSNLLLIVKNNNDNG